MTQFYLRLISLLFAVLFCSSSVFAQDKHARVVGGEQVMTTEYPWMVALIDAGRSPLQGQYCGGTLIAPTWVLTAAHCVTHDYSTRPLSPDLIEVVFNFTNLRNTPKPIAVKQVIVHPGYEVRLLQHDLALLELTTATDITPVALLAANVKAEALLDLSTLILGWGSTNNLGSIPDQLHAARLPLMPNAQCDAVLSDAGVIKPNEIFTNHLCAGGVELGRDSCVGDSGGPLIINDPKRQAIQIGLVSFGGGWCGHLPGVYTRISSFEQFIKSYVIAAKFVSLPTAESTETITACDATQTPVPAAVSLSLYSSGSYIKLTWQAVAEASGYKLLYLPMDVSASEIGSLDVGLNTELEGYLDGTENYYVAIQAYNCTGNSALSNIGVLWFN